MIISSRAPAPVGPYPHARRAGGLLFLSGIGPRRPGSNEIPATFEEQCRSVFQNVRTVLEDRTLHAELPGYPEYAARVRWRLLPHVF